MPERRLPLRVVIDARPLTQSAGGFRSYVRTLLAGMNELPGEGGGILLYVDRTLPPDCAALLPPRAEIRVLHPSRLRTDLTLFGKQLRRDAPDIVHGTANYLPPGLSASICQTVTIHDAFGIKAYPWDEPLHKWTLRDRVMNRYWALMTRQSARRARAIITVSQYSKTELLSALPGLPEGKISVIYNGLTLSAPPVLRVRDVGRVLVMAAPDSRKNLVVVARAFGTEGRGVWGSQPVPLLDVVCGSEKTARRSEALLHEHGVQNFCLLTCPDEAALANAFTYAGAFVWPSRGEGFGLPPLEALRCGCPVVSSSAPAMPEILSDVPLYFDPDNCHDLIAKLSFMLTHPKERQARSKEGRRYSERFTPEYVARSHYKVWYKVFAGAKAGRP